MGKGKGKGKGKDAAEVATPDDAADGTVPDTGKDTPGELRVINVDADPANANWPKRTRDITDYPMVFPRTDDAADGTVPGGPVLTLAAAVEASGMARSTLQRRLREGAIPGARRTESGGWAIPYAGLVAAGIIGATTPADAPRKVDAAAELETVRAELDLERARRIAAEALTDAERARAELALQYVDDLRAALADARRMLPSGSAPADAPARSRWWRRQ